MAAKCRNGTILWIDLETERTWTQDIPEKIYEAFIGGKGLGTYLLYINVDERVDPLGPENSLFFLTGPLQALRAPSVGRWSLVTKSPLTGLYLDTHCGGAFGREIKKAGYDALCVKGISEKPIIISLTDDGITFLSAQNLWNKGIPMTTNRVHDLTPKGSVVYAIGPAGEKMVRYAMGSCEIAHQTGRGGAGAVMGSKKIKAIAAKGSFEFGPADEDALQSVNKEVAKTWREKSDYGFKDIGTGFLPPVANALGQFPTRNWQSGYFEDIDGLDMYDAEEQFGLGDHYSCPHCMMRCTRAYRTDNPEEQNKDVTSTVEYETLGMMGGNLGISDVQGVLKLNFLADEYGLDTISAGSTIGFVMECMERGIISEDDLGFKVAFGDVDGAIRLLRLIAQRKGLGDLLAEGVKSTSAKLGPEAEELAAHVKGLDFAAWDPRGRRGMGLSYATADVGASHLRGWPNTTEPPDAPAVSMVDSMVRARDEKVLTDSLVTCHFTYHLPLSFQQKIQLLNGATGLAYTEESVLEFAARVAALSRMFNVREGISRTDDILPKKFWTPQSQGPREGMVSFVSEKDFNDSLDEFYRIRGWDANGIPTKATLNDLGLSSMI